MIRLAAILALLAAPAAAQQRALVVGPGDEVVIGPRGAVQAPPPQVALAPRPRLAPQGPPPLIGRGVGKWVGSPWLLAPLAAAGALAVMLPGSSGGGAAGISGPTATVAR